MPNVCGPRRSTTLMCGSECTNIWRCAKANCTQILRNPRARKRSKSLPRSKKVLDAYDPARNFGKFSRPLPATSDLRGNHAGIVGHFLGRGKTGHKYSRSHHLCADSGESERARLEALEVPLSRSKHPIPLAYPSSRHCRCQCGGCVDFSSGDLWH